MTRPMTEELEPCPFCGAQGKIISVMGFWESKAVGYGPDGARVVCASPGSDCSAAAPPFYGDQKRERAIAAWNRRSTSAAVRGMREALRSARTYLTDVAKDKSDAGRGTLEIINTALNPAGPA